MFSDSSKYIGVDFAVGRRHELLGAPELLFLATPSESFPLEITVTWQVNAQILCGSRMNSSSAASVHCFAVHFEKDLRRNSIVA